MSHSLLKYAEPTLSGRIYPTEEIVSLFHQIRDYTLSDYGALIMLDEPVGGVVPMDRIVGRVTDVWLEKGHIMGEVQIMDTPCGLIYKTLKESGAELFFKIAMIGNVDHNGVTSNIKYICTYVSATQ